MAVVEPSPEQAAKFRRDCGARRFAYNWAVTQIKVSFGVGQETREYDSAVWSAYSLRKRWNQKDSARKKKPGRPIASVQLHPFSGPQPTGPPPTPGSR